MPEDKFLLIVAGNRLNDDINDEYISLMSETFHYNTHLDNIEKLSNYDVLYEKYPLFKEHKKSKFKY